MTYYDGTNGTVANSVNGDYNNPLYDYKQKDTARSRKEWYRAVWEIIDLLAATIFTWKGLPERLNPFYIEQNLIHYGHVLAYHDDTMEGGYQRGVLHGYFNNKINQYGEQVEYTTMPLDGTRGRTFNRFTDKCVVIGNNGYYRPLPRIINKYVERIVNIKGVQEVNLNALKAPLMLIGSKEYQLDIQKQLDRLDGNHPFIIVDPDIALKRKNRKGGTPANQDINDLLPVRDTKTDAHLPILSDEETQAWTQLFRFLGIKTVNEDKKERMVVDEANAASEMVNSFLVQGYVMRKHAADMINEKGIFKDKVTVEINKNMFGEDEAFELAGIKKPAANTEDEGGSDA